MIQLPAERLGLGVFTTPEISLAGQLQHFQIIRPLRQYRLNQLCSFGGVPALQVELRGGDGGNFIGGIKRLRLLHKLLPVAFIPGATGELRGTE